MKEQRKAAQSMLKFRKQFVNIAICPGCAIPELDLLVRLDFYFNHENQQYGL